MDSNVTKFVKKKTTLVKLQQKLINKFGPHITIYIFEFCDSVEYITSFLWNNVTDDIRKKILNIFRFSFSDRNIFPLTGILESENVGKMFIDNAFPVCDSTQIYSIKKDKNVQLVDHRDLNVLFNKIKNQYYEHVYSDYNYYEYIHLNIDNMSLNEKDLLLFSKALRQFSAFERKEGVDLSRQYHPDKENKTQNTNIMCNRIRFNFMNKSTADLIKYSLLHYIALNKKTSIKLFFMLCDYFVVSPTRFLNKCTKAKNYQLCEKIIDVVINNGSPIDMHDDLWYCSKSVIKNPTHPIIEKIMSCTIRRADIQKTAYKIAICMKDETLILQKANVFRSCNPQPSFIHSYFGPDFNTDLTYLRLCTYAETCNIEGWSTFVNRIGKNSVNEYIIKCIEKEVSDGRKTSEMYKHMVNSINYKKLNQHQKVKFTKLTSDLVVKGRKPGAKPKAYYTENDAKQLSKFVGCLMRC